MVTANSSPFFRLLPYILRYRRRLTIGIGCVFLTTAVSLASPRVLQYAIDDLDDLTTVVTRGRLALYAGLLLSIALIGGGFRFLMRRIVIGVSREIEYDLRNDFFAHLLRLSLSYFHTHRTGDLMSRATSDLSAVRMMVGPAIMYSVNTALVLVVAIIMMLAIDVRLTLIALTPLPLVSLSVWLFGRAIYKRSERIQAQLADMSAIVQETLAGVRVVRAYGREEVELERFRCANQEYVERNRRLIQLQGLFYPSLAFFLGLGAWLVLWLGSRQVILGRITVGEFVAFNAYLVMLSWPMIAFGWVTNILQRGMASWQRMLEVLDVEPSVRDALAPAALRQPEEVRGRVEFRNLSFAYNGRPVLDRVSVTIEPGQTLAIVGATGSGKSTLVSLLPRLYDPPPGTVFIDGLDVRQIPLAVLRGAIGYVPQEPLLFSDTIAENVAFGARAEPQATQGTPDLVQRAVAIARLDKDLAEFPSGSDTFVGERGITLSGGQKQRAALARALMVDPRILILDDALSAVDTYTEAEILSRLRRVLKQRTSIIVSHRISTVRDADVIVVLDHGRVIEQGSHDDLIAQGGLYADLFRQQRLEAELDAS